MGVCRTIVRTLVMPGMKSYCRRPEIRTQTGRVMGAQRGRHEKGDQGYCIEESLIVREGGLGTLAVHAHAHTRTQRRRDWLISSLAAVVPA